MKKRLIISFISTLICVAVVIMISFRLIAVEKLLRPPKPGGDNRILFESFEKHVGSDYDLKFVSYDKHNAAFKYIDIDNDDDNEAIVTYTSIENINAIRISVFDKINKKWKCVSDVESEHNHIAFIDFSDLDNDSSQEMIVGFSQKREIHPLHIIVYKFNSDEKGLSMDELLKYDCSYINICDIDKDGCDEIVAVRLNHTDTSKRCQLLLFKSDSNKLTEYENVEFDTVFSEISSVTVGSASFGNKKEIYVNGYTNSGKKVTYRCEYIVGENALTAPNS